MAGIVNVCFSAGPSLRHTSSIFACVYNVIVCVHLGGFQHLLSFLHVLSGTWI